MGIGLFGGISRLHYQGRKHTKRVNMTFHTVNAKTRDLCMAFVQLALRSFREVVCYRGLFYPVIVRSHASTRSH
jgi:hypothetical protein